MPLANFNSIKVRLEQAEEYTFNVIEPHFNSIKVRLKHDVKQYATDFWLFQFHKGTIKTGFIGVGYRLDKIFQFHKGTIKTGQKSGVREPSVISIP